MRAIVWARKAVDLAPDEDRGVRRLITLLDRSGDTAGAIRAYDDYAARLARDLDLEPSPETAALAAAIRARASRAAPLRDRRVVPPAPHPLHGARHSPAPPVAGNVLAVYPFVVRGARDLEYLREGMIDLLSSALDGAGDLRTVDPRAVLAAPLPDLDASGGGDTDAYAVGAGLLVSGTVIRAGDRIRVSAALHRTGHGKRRAGGGPGGG